MTKKEMYLTIIEMALENGNSEMAEFCNKEIAMLDKKSASNEKRKAKRAEEHAELENEILNVLASVGIATTNEIAMEMGVPFQRITPRLTEMAKRGEVIRKQIKKDILWELPTELEEPTE